MPNNDTTGVKIGQLDPLSQIQGGEKIPFETADGSDNGNVTIEQIKAYAQEGIEADRAMTEEEISNAIEAAG